MAKTGKKITLKCKCKQQNREIICIWHGREMAKLTNKELRSQYGKDQQLHIFCQSINEQFKTDIK